MESKNERDVSILVAVASAIGLGATLALSQALRIDKPKITFQLSIWTGIAFLSGFNLTFAYLRFLFTHGDRTPRLFRRSGLIMLIVMTAGALLYPLRFFPMDVLVDRFAGVGAALCFIASGLTLIWRVVLAAQIEEEEQETKEQHPTTVDPRPQAPDLARIDWGSTPIDEESYPAQGAR